MDAQILLDNFGAIAEAPGGVDRLRQLILDLAIHGQLVSQDPNDQPVSSEQLAAGRNGLLALEQISKPRYPEGQPVERPPYSIPTTWHWYHLGDVGAVVGGGTPSSQESRFWADRNAVPWLTPADMRRQTSRYVTHGDRDITEEGLASSSAQLLPARSVLFSSRAPIGHVGIAQTPLATNQGFKSCVPYLPEMSEYLYVFLKKIGPEISDAATGTTFKEVSGKQVALIPVPVPPLAEQERIVAKVDELMQFCDDLEACQQARHQVTTRLRASCLDALTNAETDDDLHTAWSRVDANWDALTDHHDSISELRKAVLQLAICGKLSAAASSDKLPSVALAAGQITTKSSTDHTPEAGAFPFELPASWTWRRLQDLVDPERAISYGVIKLGPDPGPTNGVPILRCSDVRFRHIDRRGIRFIKPALSADYGRTVLRGGELLVNIRGTLGGCAVVPADMAGFNVAREVAVIPVAEVNPEYLLTVFSAPYFQSSVAAALRGTAYKGLNLGSLREFPIPVPPRSEQNRIETEVRGLMSRCDELEHALLQRNEASRRLASAVV